MLYLCLQKSSLPGFLVLMFLPDMSPRDSTQAHLLSKVERKIQSPLDLCNVPLKTFQILDFFPEPAKDTLRLVILLIRVFMFCIDKIESARDSKVLCKQLKNHDGELSSTDHIKTEISHKP